MSEKIYRVQMNSKGMPNFSTAVEIADRPQGEWYFVGDNMFQCTSCGEVYSARQFEMMRNRTTDPLFPKGCPHCGERMKGADDE